MFFIEVGHGEAGIDCLRFIMKGEPRARAAGQGGPRAVAALDDRQPKLGGRGTMKGRVL